MPEKYQRLNPGLMVDVRILSAAQRVERTIRLDDDSELEGFPGPGG
jgi:hypothetical protein